MVLGDTVVNLERAGYRHLARSGSQSWCRIRFVTVLSLGVVQTKSTWCADRLEDESVGFLPRIKFHSLCI